MSPRAAQIFGRPESELIFCCARKELTFRARERIQQLLREPMDWALVLRKAQWHGLLPLLSKHLDAMSPEAVPPPVLAELKRLFQGIARRNLRLAAELLKLHSTFSSHGIPVVPFKGPITALALYGDLSLRRFADLDLLIRKADILKARKILMDRGLLPQFELTEKEELIYFDFRSEHAFISPDKQLVIDLHCALTPRYFSRTLDLDRYWDRLRPLRLGDTEVLTFSPDDLLLILCIHGAKDMWERLILVADIAEILRNSAPLDWTAIFHEAEAVGGSRMLRHGLLLASELLEVDLPAKVAPALQQDSGARWLAAQATKRLLQAEDGPPSHLQRLRFAYRSIARPYDGFRYVAEQVFTSTPLEWRLFRLPESLYFLYGFVRVFRLAGKYLRILAGRAPVTVSDFEPTPDEVAIRMLELARVTPTDVIYDLGAGDGRVLILAAQRFGARGFGFEIDPQRLQQARSNAKKAGVQSLVQFKKQSMLDADLSNATVVTLYLPWATTLRLRPRLQRELKPGTRIVSHESGLADWVPERMETIDAPQGKKATLYLWRVGA
jgi:hypothetical protein